MDRHGRLFGECIFLSQDQVKPLCNKIIPGPIKSLKKKIEPRLPYQSNRYHNPYYVKQSPQEYLGYKILSPTTAGSQMIWREKRDAQIKPQGISPHAAFHSHTPDPKGHISEVPKSLERKLADSDFPPPPRVPTTEEVMQELVDVSIQYTNCADPVKREAR